MTNIVELLPEEKLKKLADFLRLDVPALQQSTLEEVKAKLTGQTLEGAAPPSLPRLNEIADLKRTLDRLTQQGWQDSFEDCPSKNLSNLVVSDPEARESILITFPDNEKEREQTIDHIKKRYLEITGNPFPKPVVYNSKDELPERLKAAFSDKSFPRSIVTFTFKDAKQHAEFRDTVIEPLKKEGKITLTALPTLPVQQTETQENNPATALRFRR